MEEVRKRWPRRRGRGIRVSSKVKRLWVKGLRTRLIDFFRLLRTWGCRRRPSVSENYLYYKPLRRSNSFYADAIADCIDFIKRSS